MARIHRRNMQGILGLPLLLVALSLGVSLPSCTRKHPPASAHGTSVAVKIGSPVFHFDYEKTRSLTIDKADPMTGDHWMARVERQSGHEFHDDDSWKISSYSENASLPDRLANRSLILHLLDTLSTLHPVAAVQDNGGGDAARANFGLDPPRYALRWEAEDPQKPGTFRSFEVEIGAPVGSALDTNRLAYGSFPPDRTIYQLDGAVLPMLEYIKTFSVLRQQTLSPVDSDAVDQIEVRRPGKAAFYAQRDGAVWTNRRHRPWQEDVQGFLDRITHLRIQSFIDHGSDASALRSTLDRRSVAEIILKDRFGHPTIIRLAKNGARALAEVSTRSGAVFELYPGALSRLSP